MMWNLMKGFPQGANFSPFLSIIQLTLLGDPLFASLLMYADDGLFYSKKKFNELDVHRFFKKLGAKVNWEKSHWIRHNYVWQRPLQFLGLCYDGHLKELRASTREGSVLKFDTDKKTLVQVVADAVTSGVVHVPKVGLGANPGDEYVA